MYDSRYSARVTIAIAGEVETGITTHSNPDLPGASWLSIRTGQVLTYCRHPRTVIGCAAAWNNAKITAARQLLPETSNHQPGSLTGLAVQLNADPDDSWDITGYTSRVAPDGVGFLDVRAGALTLRCYDQLAVRTLQQIWHEAAALAHLVWRERKLDRT